ncbi:mutator type transposase [Tanacetum coccineum]
MGSDQGNEMGSDGVEGSDHEQGGDHDQGSGEEHGSDHDQGSSEEQGVNDDVNIIDKEHIIDGVEVNMKGFRFSVDEDVVPTPLHPQKNVTQNDLKVINFDSFDSDVGDDNLIQLNLYIPTKAIHDQMFKDNGRELLGLDGAFMKGQYPGQLLTAVEVDGNNGFYPLAYEIVESESLESWLWFLTQLGGLLPAIKRLFPSAEHRRWEVSGIPCKHVVTCIHDLVDHGIEIGRPPKKKERSAGEVKSMVGAGKMSSKWLQITFQHCKGKGHNKMGCKKAATSANQPQSIQPVATQVPASASQQHSSQHAASQVQASASQPHATHHVVSQGQASGSGCQGFVRRTKKAAKRMTENALSAQVPITPSTTQPSAATPRTAGQTSSQKRTKKSANRCLAPTKHA